MQPRSGTLRYLLAGGFHTLAYEEWGEGCLERFNGMWAFALWDGRNRELFCARDRSGVKPFYYYANHSFFAFASEIKGLLTL